MTKDLEKLEYLILGVRERTGLILHFHAADC